MENLQRNISINSLKLYNNIYKYIQEYQDINIIKQHCMQKTKLISLRDNINLPARDTKTTIKCPKCCMNRVRNNSQYRVVPHQQPNDRFLRRIKRRYQSGNLTRYQLRCVKQLQKSSENQLVIKCRICQTKSIEILRKPQKINNKVATKLEIRNNKNEKKIIRPPPQLKINTKRNKKQQKNQNKKMNERLGKLNKFLSEPQAVKSSSLKDFIKSVVT